MSAPDTCTRCDGTGHHSTACPVAEALRPQPKRGLLAALLSLLKGK
jgi:hypothetical protein